MNAVKRFKLLINILHVSIQAVGYLAVALPAALLYLTATPGPIAGLLDFVRDRADVNRSL